MTIAINNETWSITETGWHHDPTIFLCIHFKNAHNHAFCLRLEEETVANYFSNDRCKDTAVKKICKDDHLLGKISYELTNPEVEKKMREKDIHCIRLEPKDCKHLASIGVNTVYRTPGLTVYDSRLLSRAQFEANPLSRRD
jgi:hypothetical protein